MPLTLVYRCCMLCSGWVGEAGWSKDFTIVCHRQGQLHLGRFDYSRDNVFQDIPSFDGASDQIERIRVNASCSFTATDAFLIHSSCYRVFLDHPASQMGIDQLFRLCQSLQPDRHRHFGHDAPFELLNCLDPFAPIVPFDVSTLCTGPYMMVENADCDSRLFTLPIEILTMILDYLTPTDLIQFFRTSKIALDYGDAFLRQKPRQFYRCIATDDESTSKRRLMLALFLRFPKYHSTGLDLRWEVVSRITKLRKYIRSISRDLTTPTVDVWAPMKLVDHAYGFWDLFAVLPFELRAITIYGIEIKGHVYVCGIEFLTRCSSQRFGTESKLVSRIDILYNEVDVIRFLVDSLGIRSLRFGRSAWSFEVPERTQCWEGFSLRKGEGRLRIVRDALKFRHIGWCSANILSFEETILMRNNHASWKGQIDEGHFVSRNPQIEKDMVSNIGNFTAEVLWIPENLSGITLYRGIDRIYGIASNSSSGTSIAGETAERSEHFSIHGPDEVLTEVLIRIRSQFSSPRLTLKTNWNRQCSFGVGSASDELYINRTLKPPDHCYIKGFYFRLGLGIESFGIIYGQKNS